MTMASMSILFPRPPQITRYPMSMQAQRLLMIPVTLPGYVGKNTTEKLTFPFEAESASGLHSKGNMCRLERLTATPLAREH